jgi:hypothetical protein
MTPETRGTLIGMAVLLVGRVVCDWWRARRARRHLAEYRAWLYALPAPTAAVRRPIRWYVGHATRDVTEHYRRGRGFVEYFAADAERFRVLLGDAPMTKGLEVVP